MAQYIQAGDLTKKGLRPSYTMHPDTLDAFKPET